MNFDPTPEQQSALDLFRSGDSMVIEAGAGTGKTSTLIMIGDSTDARGQYVAFNKAIVTEAGSKLPRNVAANTAHSLAFQAIGKTYSHRLRAPRVKPWDLARMLDVERFVIRYGSQTKTLDAGFLAGLVMRGITRFCQTADLQPMPKHIPYVDGIDVPTAQGHRTYVNNDRLRDQLADALAYAWADLTKTQGQLPFRHEHYLKLWQLSDPKIPAEFILFDEAQDANPVMAAIVAAQEHAQCVYVGDSQQQIYEFTGAVNAMAEFDATHRTFLTQSFRFGDAVAETANLVLSKIPSADLRLRGFEKISSTVETLDDPRAILCRTNARSVEELLTETERGRRAHLVGGGGEVAAFARGAKSLQDGKHSSHPDLACFGSWGEVLDYVDNDPQGSELAGMTKLIQKFGVETVLRALDGNAQASTADVTISTAHKAKGREWSSVKIANDFPPEVEGDAEFRLMYVAVTRAQHVLDDGSIRAHYDPTVAKAAKR